jgi:hypothetical protein
VVVLMNWCEATDMQLYQITGMAQWLTKAHMPYALLPPPYALLPPPLLLLLLLLCPSDCSKGQVACRELAAVRLVG